MDPLTIGILVGVAASSAAAALGWRGGRKRPASTRRESATPAPSNALRVGDVLLYLGEEYWLAGEIALMREGAAALRIFSAPQPGGDRWVAIPRQGQSVWVLSADAALEALGWPGIELPASGRIMRRTEHGSAAIATSGEGVSDWEGTGRFALFRAHDGVALVIEGTANRRLALVGREIPRELIQKLG